MARSPAREARALLRQLPAEHFGEDQRCNDRGIRLNDKARRGRAKFAPGNFLVRHRARIRTVARGGIADLTKITPLRDLLGDQVLIQKRHNANWKIASDASADLKETNG